MTELHSEFLSVDILTMNEGEKYENIHYFLPNVCSTTDKGANSSRNWVLSQHLTNNPEEKETVLNTTISSENFHLKLF